MEKKGSCKNAFDSLSDIKPGRDTWRIQARVLRLWRVPAFLNPKETNSIEMVLIDEKGGKMHATIRKPMLHMFESKIEEGHTYQMSNFFVAPSSGSYRTTLHPYKLVFQMRTKVHNGSGMAISRYGLSPTKIEAICSFTQDYDYLVDVIGLVTGISAEREYIRDGKITKMVVIELTDESGKCECALFGDYAMDFKKSMGEGNKALPVCVVQFAKVKIFRDRASMQNVIHTTRILVNPKIAEVEEFKNRIAVLGIETNSDIPMIGSGARPSEEDEFLKIYPKMTIGQLLNGEADGCCVVGGTVARICEGEDWWYSACKCHKSVTGNAGSFYCNDCAQIIFNVVPRFKVKVEVTDEECLGVFIIFDSDMSRVLEKSCAQLVTVAKGENAGYCPSEFDCLIGKKVLFVVDPSSVSTSRSDGSYRVKRCCFDSKIIESFDGIGPMIAPIKSIVSAGGHASEGSSRAGTPDDDDDVFDNSSRSETPDGDDVSDDCEVVEETQASKFADECIVSPVSGRKESVVRKAGKALKRSLAVEFEEVAAAEKKHVLKAVKIEKE